MKKIVFLLTLLLLCGIVCSCTGQQKTAYELYCEEHPDYMGTEEAFLKSIEEGLEKGAYELYCEANPGYTGTEAEWLEALRGGKLTMVYTVTFDTGCGETPFTQAVRLGEKASCPVVPERLGYRLAGWLCADGEAWNFDTDTVSKDMTLTAIWEYATLELPVINIDTSGAAIQSKEDYTDMVFSLENCDGELSEITGGIRLRGNSTMGYDKKPYRIKFDKKQSLFGLEKAKSWVLLAEYLDPSAMHNYTAFSLGAEMDGIAFTATPNKVNVYLNGEYIGLYTLCEQIQENEGRMDIELDEISEDFVELKDYNFFISMDKSCVNDAGAKLDETYFYIEEYDRVFELKYPAKDQFATEEQFASFMSQLKVYVKDLMDAFHAKDAEKIRAEVNVNSLVDYLIIDQIMGEHDHEWKSFHMYFTNTSDNAEENGKLSFGPIWDYDFSLNVPWTGTPNDSFEIYNYIFYSNLFFQSIADIPEFYQLIEERYHELAKPAMEKYIEELDTLCDSMKESLELNQALWYDGISTSLTEKNVQFLKDYLIARIEYLDEEWALDE